MFGDLSDIAMNSVAMESKTVNERYVCWGGGGIF